MSIDYERDLITEEPAVIIPQAITIRDMLGYTDGYCGHEAVSFNLETQAVIDLDQLIINGDDISRDTYSEDWYRIIRLPEGYIVDASHKEVVDDIGKLKEPINVIEGKMFQFAAKYVAAVGFIKSVVELDVFNRITEERHNIRFDSNRFDNAKTNRSLE